ncbi:TolB-like translocation protein [Nocardia aurantia]|uniref:Uncharacterized protein n=1 Tax=Nocardia aurantia TaxID=2585199 RepID=A0A7K0DPS7_9NOCA|nr:hypothetical protein [Nocardia aurantia]MQY27701.1 hypothetical protein [Nocardia aurantia]
MRHGNFARVISALAAVALLAAGCGGGDTPAAHAPDPGRVTVTELPVPPTAPTAAAGSCTAQVNPHRTGCVDPGWGAIGSPGTYWGTGRATLLGVTFAGAPAAPDPASVYQGPQVLLVRTDGTLFPNGDPWKCLTCGVPAANRLGVTDTAFTYPLNGFHDGKRALAGTSILDCGDYQVFDDRCTPERLHIYPIRWNVTPDGSGPGGEIRELRMNPDDVHIGWNHMILDNGRYDEQAYMGRLVFDPAPAAGEPRAPRYDLTAVTTLFSAAPEYQPYQVVPGHPDQLRWNSAGMIGEFRGWSADGREALGIQSYLSASVDAWATDNTTGRSRPLTDHAEYTDPMAVSPDGEWTVALQVNGSDRLHFLSALPGVPPLIDQLGATGYVSGIRNNGQRRFFAPWLVDRDGKRARQINADGDPNWNAAADPAWLADGTGVVYAENLVTAPACGAPNPLPCPASGEPGGRHSRVMLARFDGLAPKSVTPVAPVPDSVDWGTPYHPGDPMPVRPQLPAGIYTLPGKAHGSARAEIAEDAAGVSMSVSYTDFSDDGATVVDGTESIRRPRSLLGGITLQENLTVSGAHTGTKVTSEPAGFTLAPTVLENNFQATGTLTTTLDGRTYTQPQNGM